MEEGIAPQTSDPDSPQPLAVARDTRHDRAWLRTLAVIGVGVILLGFAGIPASHLIHSTQPVASVSCLDSTCTYGMSMSSGMKGMNGMGTDGSSAAMGAPTAPARHAHSAGFWQTLLHDLHLR